MIRHEQAEPAMPRELLVIMLYRRQHSSADVRAAQLVLVPGHTIDGDEKPTAFSDGLRNCVRQLFADGQVHVSECNGIGHSIKRKAAAAARTG